MSYNGLQRTLLRDADKYLELGYQVALAKGKTFLKEYKNDHDPWKMQTQEDFAFDGISIIPNGLVCVDIDVPDFGVVSESLPPTWKERSPHGYHLWYALPDGPVWGPKIKWHPHVDLLTRMTIVPMSEENIRRVTYDNPADTNSGPLHWGEHILSSGTPGYTRLYPDEAPTKSNLVIAPQWLQDALK